MKKLFLLIPALVISMMMSAKEIQISSGTSNIIHYTIAASTTSDGDVIVLTSDGDQPYYSTAGEDDYTKLVKDLTIKAADGVHPVVKLEVPFRSTGGKTVKFIGITFDGTSLSSNYDFYFRFYDANDNLEFEDCEFKNISKYVFDVYTGKSANSLKLTNCRLHDISSRGILNRGTLTSLEINGGQIYNFTGYPVLDNYDGATLGKVKINGTEFYNNAKDIISGVATSHADSCIINNCYFHNNSRSAVYFAASSVSGVETCDGVIVKNSTFANNDLSASSRSVIDVFNNGETEVANVEVTVDHCTFYYNTTKNYDYSCIRSRKSTKVNITNSIFAYPSAIEFYATNCYGGTISNTLVYNLNKGHRKSGGNPAVSNTITDAPLFTDAANGDFSLAGDWVTPSISPARGAATDGSDLGDPRWYTDEVLPSSNFVAPYAFIGAKAVVRDNMELDGNNYIHSKSAGGSAIWKIHAMRAGNVQVTLNMDPDGQVIGHTYHVEVFDANGNSMGEVNEGGWYNNVDDKVLPGTIAFPAEGDYKIVLTNSVSGTKSTIKGITLAYAGGAIVNVPAEELLGTEAVRVDAGHLKVTKLANGDLQYGDNQYPLDEYVYWNINATKLGDMKVTLNVVAPGEGDPSSHEFLVELYSNLNESPISSSAEVSATSGTGARVLPTAINIPATGNYIVKLTNKKQWSSAILHSVEFEYLGGATITVPANELIAEEAVLVDGGHLRVSKLANGDLQYGDNEYPLQEYVYWNINATKYGSMNVTANVVFNTEKDAEHQSSHQFLVELYSDLNETPISSSEEESATSKTGEVHMPALNIPAVGTYIVKLTNKKQWSSAILHSFEFAYAGGEVTDVPGQIVAEDAMLLKEDGGTLKMYLDENGDIKYNNNGYNLTEYALWNINATEAGEMIVTLNVTHSGHLFTVELYEGETLKSSVAEPDANEWHSGDLELENHLNIPAAGSYTVKLINRQQYSGGAIHGITFTPYVAPAAVVIDEMDEDNSAWIGYKDGDPVNVTLNRTLKAGMYNTFCLPFAVSSTQCKAVFGNDVEIYTLGSAVVEGTVLNVTLDPSDDIYQGTPVFIKPSADVVNPSFEGVSIVKETPASTTKTNANLVGTFVKTTLTGGENILYLGPSNTLYYPEIDTPIKGMRAWFAIHDAPTPAPAIKRMNIVNAPAVVTEINLIDADNKAVKTIENGQLIITIDGVRYNVMGTKIQ